MTKAQKIHNQAEKAMKEAVRKLVAEHKKMGMLLAIWKNGKVVRVPAVQKRKKM